MADYARVVTFDADDAALEAMSPPDAGTIRRVSVDAYEVVLERQLP